MGLYTVAECEAQIRALDTQITRLIAMPAQQSIDGNFISFQGKISDLRALRQDWEKRLLQAQLEDNDQHPAQGPDFEV